MTSVSKRDLQTYVHQKIKKAIRIYHIRGVINILFEEMIRDLRDGKSIKIINFGTLILKKMPPRHYYDVRFRCVMTSPGHRIMRFFMTERIRKKLCQYLDIDELKKSS